MRAYELWVRASQASKRGEGTLEAYHPLGHAEDKSERINRVKGRSNQPFDYSNPPLFQSLFLSLPVKAFDTRSVLCVSCPETIHLCRAILRFGGLNIGFQFLNLVLVLRLFFFRPVEFREGHENPIEHRLMGFVLLTIYRYG